MNTIKYILIIITGILTFPFQVSSVELVRTDRVWEYWGWDGQSSIIYIHYVDFDDSNPLMFGGNAYLRSRIFKSIKCEEIHLTTNPIQLKVIEEEDRDYTLFYMREDEGKVYSLLTEDKNENNEAEYNYRDWLVYDWNKENHSEWCYYPEWLRCSGYISEMSPTHVKYLESIIIDGEECKRMTLGWNGSYFPEDIVFIEGIGCDAGGSLGYPIFDKLAGVADNSKYPQIDSYLNKVYNSSGEEIFFNEKNPVKISSQINKVLSDGLQKDFNTYDLDGNIINQTIAGSIYIRDGKKFVAN